MTLDVRVSRDLHIDRQRLLDRIDLLGRIGALDGGGVSRLALTDADRTARDLVMRWMDERGLAVSVDRIGNIVGVRPGREPGPPVMTGSHIDTVASAGVLDGCLGVVAGIEIIQVLDELDIATRWPLAVAVFTNEEGSRFPPDMMGSLVYVGGLAVDAALETTGIDGTTVGTELTRIGYAGDSPCPGPAPRAFVELHVEQGPVLESSDVVIGAVDGVQGISWQEVTIEGQANHAGTTPMRLRRDAGLVAAEIATFVRRLAIEIGGDQVATVGAITLAPNLVNVIPGKATVTIDLRNTEELRLRYAERALEAFLDEIASSEGVEIRTRRLARFEPVEFDRSIIDRVESNARALGLSSRRLPAGAGHDAQMLARVCPAGMVFVPSRAGISHNPAEHTEPVMVEAGANVLMHTLVQLAEGPA